MLTAHLVLTGSCGARERESQASSEQSVRDREQREDSSGQWRDRERGPGLKLTHNGGQVANTDTKLCCEAHFGM